MTSIADTLALALLHSRSGQADTGEVEAIFSRAIDVGLAVPAP